MKNLVIAAIATATAIASAGMAQAEPNGGGSNHSVIVTTVNGVTKVVVDGVQLYGEEAQPYIDAANAKGKFHEKW